MIKSSETRDEQWLLLQYSSVGNPYFGIEHKIIIILCQSRDFPLSYTVIATIVHHLFHYFLSLGFLLHFIFIIFNIRTSLFSFLISIQLAINM